MTRVGMKIALAFLFFVSTGMAAVDGTVVNATTGKPQAGVTVNLVQPGAGGMQQLGSIKSDAEGKFAIDKSFPPGPALIQADYQGATYTLILPPGGPTNGVRVSVYDATKNPIAAKVDQRMLVLEPTAGALNITETLLLKNETNTTFQDSAKGSVQVYLPGPSEGKARVTINPPEGMPIQRPAEKTTQPNVYKVNYPIRPGETRFDVLYTLPPSDTFTSELVHPGETTRIVTPPTVTLEGEGIESLGQEPQTQAHIYNVVNNKFALKITGIGSLRDSGVGGGADADEDNGSPKVEVAPARLYTRLGWVLGLTFGILAFGGLLLYRREVA